MARLSISVLGSFQVTLDGSVLTDFRTDKARALLAYLALQPGQPHRREALGALFWPDCADVVARRNLRQTLYTLRQALSQHDDLASPYLVVTQRDIQFSATSDYWLDAAAFSDLLQPCPLHRDQPARVCQFCLQHLAQAVELYRGAFLNGLAPGDSLGFEEWMRSRQEQFHQLALTALARLADWHEAHGENERAISYAQRQLELEPWREEAHLVLMRVFVHDGQRSAALRQYALCCRALEDELGIGPAVETQQIYEGIRSQSLQPLLVAPRNPYKGLHFFTEADAPQFFGRETFVDRLAAAAQERSLAAVIGSSGSGKSSLIFAGLVPRLTLRPDRTWPASWLVASFRPGTQPFASLAAALAPLLYRDRALEEYQTAIGSLADDLSRNPAALRQALAQILQDRPPSTRLLLVADQFEEIFALVPDPETRCCFLDMLLAVISAQPGLAPLGNEDSGAGPRVCLVAGLRVDFMGQALAYRPLADALEPGSLLMLGPMSRGEILRAIEEPAAAQRVAFEAGLVTRLLDDVGGGSGNLPLLEFALTLLWERRPAMVLTHAAYDAIGGVHGALALHAEKVYGELDVAEQEQARRVFLQLVRPGQQTGDTRRVASRAELGEDRWQMVQRLADARLTVTGRDPGGTETAEVVHEALITGWGRLHDWLDADRSFRIWQERTRTQLAQWEGSRRDASALLRGVPLAEAEGWLTARPLDVDRPVAGFVAAGLQQRESEEQAIEARRQRELRQARAVLASETAGRRQARSLAFAMLVLALLAALAAYYAFRGGEDARQAAGRADAAQAAAQTERARAEDQAQLALSRQLAAQSVSLLGKQPDLALLLSLEAGRLGHARLDQSELMAGLHLNPYLARFLHGPADPIYLTAFSPNSQTLAGVRANGSISLWDAASGALLTTLTGSAGEDAPSVGLSPDGRLAAVGRGHEITVWDLANRLPAGPPFIGHQADIHTMAFSADDRTMISGDNAGMVLRWDLATGISVTLPITAADYTVWALSPDGRRLAISGDAPKDELLPIMVLDTTTGGPVGPPLLGHKSSDGVHGLVFSPDGQTLASSSFDKTVILWNIATGKPLHPALAGHTARALVAAFSPDGHTLASGGADNMVLLWDVATGQLLRSLAGHTNWIRGLAFSPDGRSLASASADGSAILWDISRSRQLLGATAKVRGLAFTPDGRALAASSLDQAVRLYDLASGKPAATPYPGDEHSVLTLALSPDGRTLAIASASGDVTLLDAATLQPIGRPLKGHSDVVVTVAFSPDGQTLASGSFDKSVILWNLTTHEPLGPPLTGHTNWVMSVAFSPDGKTLASGGADSRILLWDVAARRKLGPALGGHSNWVNSLAFSPDGKQLASGSSDDTVILWDVGTSLPIGLPMAGHGTPVWSVAFDPASAGRTLVSAGADGTVILWDTASQSPLAPPLFANVEMETMAVSPDGQTVAIGGFDNNVALWQLDRKPWTATACAIANRNLTPQEWQRFLQDLPYRKTCAELP